MQAIPFRVGAVSSAVLFVFTAHAQENPPAAAPADVPVQRVTISASADASAGGLKAPYAGGQVARGGRVGILGSQDTMDAPFSLTAYTQKLIQDQQAASVADVLQNDPTVRVARGFGNYQQLYMIRGLPVFSDDMSYNGLYGLLPRQYLAAELIERVEVLRGPSAFLNGAAPGGSGIGGAINIMPKRAPNGALSEVTLGVESGGQAYLAADIARRFGPDSSTGWRLSAARRDGDTAVDKEERELSVVALGVDHRSGGLRVSADVGFQDHRLKASPPSVTIASGLAIPTPPEASSNVAQSWTRSNERDVFGTLRAEYDITSQVTAWAAAGMRQGDESAIFANPTVIDATGTTSAFRFDNTREDTITTGEVGVRGAFSTGSVGHTVVASAAIYRDKSKNAFALSNFAGFADNLYAPTEVAPPDANFFVGGTLDNPLVTARTRTSSVALADTMAFAQDRVLLTVGARHQKIESLSYDYNTGAELSSYSSGRVTPIAGVVFKVSKALSLYATYIEGLVKGDIAPNTTSTVPPQPVANAGEVLKPYQSKQVELGTKWDLGRFGGSFSVFQTRKPINSVNPANLRFEETDEQRNRGAELTLFGEAMRGLRVLCGATVLRTDVSGFDAIGAPHTQANLGVEWDVPGLTGLSLNARGIHTASQFADAANTQHVPSWSRLDLSARYETEWGQRPVTLRLRVDNATDRNYWASAGGYPGAGYLVLGAPRTFIVSGSIGF